MDEQTKASAQQLLQKWIQGRHQALLEQVMLTWEEGMGRLNPDSALMDEIAALAPPAPELPAYTSLPDDADKELGAALDMVEAATSQGDVLKRLLDAVQTLVERSAIFVVKQGIATLYAARGFDSDQPRLGSPVVPPPELEALLVGRTRKALGTGAGYAALLAPLSRFEATDARIFPLRLRQKVVAIVLVDSGLRQTLDRPQQIRALVHAAEASLACLTGAKEEDRPAPAQPAAPAEPMPPHAMRTQHIPDPIPSPEITPLDPKIRQNAERSARVLVGDIELYFPQKVELGRSQGNLYNLLKDELDRSRVSFLERYGADVESEHRIFFQTVVHQLCGGNRSQLGEVPWPEGK